jgi:hypothetical protein
MILRDKYETEYFMFGNWEIVDKMVDGTESVKIFADTAFFHKRPDPATTYFTLNKEYLGEYLNSLLSFRSIVRANMTLQQSIKEKGRNLIGLIKKEYNLE